MSALAQLLNTALDNNAIGQLSKQLGTDQSKTESILGTAIPLLTGALANNSKQGNGAAALANALEKDHDGSILDDVAGYLTAGNTADGSKILKHVLGDKQSEIEHNLGSTMGTDDSVIKKALPLLAPLVMGALGKTKRQQKLSADKISAALEGEFDAGDMMKTLLDKDNDGSISDDLLSMGTKAFTSFFK